MSISIKVKGLEKAQAALREAMREIEDETEEMIAVMLQAISANTMPYVPVDTSALINSEYRITGVDQFGPYGLFGYGGDSISPNGTPVQEYAVYVHEGPQKNWQKPGASNQFLLHGVNDFIAEDMPRIVEAYQS